MNNLICLCIFIKESETRFAITVVNVDELNLVRTLEELTRTLKHLKKEFEMKDLGEIKFCLDLQIEHFSTRVLVHQSTYIKKTLKRFNIDKLHPLSSPMVFQQLCVKGTRFIPCKKDENLLSPQVAYLSTISALIYLTNCIAYILSFSVNLLVRYISALT